MRRTVKSRPWQSFLRSWAHDWRRRLHHTASTIPEIAGLADLRAIYSELLDYQRPYANGAKHLIVDGYCRSCGGNGGQRR